MTKKTRLNFVTLMVPRPNVRDLLESWKLHCLDRKDYEWHWICHIDTIPLLEEKFSYNDAHKLARELGDQYFDGYTVMLAAENKGHSQSFINCMRQVKYDYLYMEDDKIFIKDFKISAYIQDGAHQYNLQDLRGRVGHTSSSWCRKELAAKEVALWPEKGAEVVCDVEAYYKHVLKGSGLTKGPGLGVIAADNGMVSTNKQKLIRRYVNGQLTYEKAPDVLITTYIESERAARCWMLLRNTRNWMMCLDSYDTIVFANKDYPELKGYEVRRANRWASYYGQTGRMNRNVVYINPMIDPVKQAKFSFDIMAELKKDRSDLCGLANLFVKRNDIEAGRPMFMVLCRKSEISS